MTEQIIPPNVSCMEKFDRKEYNRQYRLANKERISVKKIERSRTKEGLATKIYSGQRQSSRRRKHPMPRYDLEKLKAWMFSQHNFEDLYNTWVDSGFDKNLTPSCDRIDDYKPYTLDNIQIVTWAQNYLRVSVDKKAGINNKQSKAVLQINHEGAVVAEHYSAHHASRVTGIDRGRLCACCRGEKKSAGGYIWEFA